MDRQIIPTAFIAAIVSPTIILIHGYGDDANVWDKWVDWLKSDGFNAYPVTFQHNDECGIVKQHAAELNNIINNTEVNIIAHSKGGLDARWYISHYPNQVDNLIMIATPNSGSYAAYVDFTECLGSAGLGDLVPDSEATKSHDGKDTKYYTIAGNYSTPCYIVTFRICYLVENDGLVTKESAISHYNSIGTFPLNHSSLITNKDVYQKVLPIITP
jgi:pimeloyl-ACP methyl ester carboxylesterase